MAFNPDEYLASKKKSTFDPDAYLAANKPQPSMLESGLRGAAQGASLGFSDELTGALESTAGSLGLVPDKTYEQSRDEARANNQAAQKANPVTYGAGEIGGGLASSFALPGAAATMGGRALQAGATGAIMGYGVTDKREDILPAMATGATLGAIATPLIEGGAGLISRGVNKVAGGLKSGAEKLAIKATGATGRESMGFAPEAGRELLDTRMVRAFDNPENVAQRLGQATEKSGRGISSALEQLDSAGGSLNVDSITNNLQNKIVELSKTRGNEKIISQLQNELENLATGPQSMPLSLAEQSKRNYQGQVNYASPEAEKKVSAQMANIYKTGVEEEATKLNPELANQFKEDKRLFGLLSPIQEASEKRAAQQSQKPFGGLMDVAATGVGSAVGGPVGAIVGASARNILMPRVASTSAVFTDKVSKVLQHNPQALGRYAKTLGDALARGPAALASTNFLLQQTDPEYRKLIHGDTNGQ